MASYFRVKRRESTIFLPVTQGDTFGALKEQLAQIVGTEQGRIRLFAPDKERVLENDGTVGDQQFPEGTVLYMVLMREDGDGYEAIDIAEYPEAAHAPAEREGGE